MIRIVLAVVTALNATCWLVLGVLFAPVIPGGWKTVILLALLLFVPLLVLLQGFGGRAYPSPATRLWIFRPFWYGQLFLPLLAGAGLLGMVAGLLFGVPLETGRALVTVAAVALALLSIVGFIGTRQLTVRLVEPRFSELPAELEGLRIVQLSDMHVGPHTSRRHLARVVDAVRRAQPDLIVHTGDQVDDYARDMEPFAVAFAELAAPLGSFAIAGNHDIIAGWNDVRRAMEHMGITVLVNESVPLERNGIRFRLAGTGDPAGAGWRDNGGADAAPDVPRTLRDVQPGEFSIVLAHNPALWPELAARGAHLTLSGHTHHGQFAIPALGWSVASLFLEHAMGLHERNGSVLYISPGTNYWGIPFRIGARPEVTVVVLRSDGS